MVVGAVGHDLVAQLDQAGPQGARVGLHLLLIGLELGCAGVLQGHGERGDLVVVWAALQQGVGLSIVKC